MTPAQMPAGGCGDDAFMFPVQSKDGHQKGEKPWHLLLGAQAIMEMANFVLPEDNRLAVVVDNKLV